MLFDFFMLPCLVEFLDITSFRHVFGRTQIKFSCDPGNVLEIQSPEEIPVC
jgi:hypothetical protein